MANDQGRPGAPTMAISTAQGTAILTSRRCSLPCSRLALLCFLVVLVGCLFCPGLGGQVGAQERVAAAAEDASDEAAANPAESIPDNAQPAEEQARTDLPNGRAQGGNNPREEIQEDTDRRIGRVIRIGLPITGPTTANIRQYVADLAQQAEAKRQRLVLILQFEVQEDEKQYAARSEFGACYDLAEFLTSPRLADTTTVAYIPQPVEGHAVLVALACDQIIMSSEGELGAAGIADGRITPPMLSAYRHIAERRRTIPAEVALGLLDPNRTVLEVETDVERRYTTPEGLEALREERTIRGTPRVLFPRGEFGRLSGREARELDFVSYLADEFSDVIRSLELPPSQVEEVNLLGQRWRAVQVEIKGPLRAEIVNRAQRLIEDAIRRDDANFVCVRIDSAGGSPADALRFATFLAADLPSDEIRTVAYVPYQALADAALITAACDHVIVHPDTTLGGEGDVVFQPRQIEQVKTTLREVLSKRTHRSWSLVAAMVDPELEVFRCTRRGNQRYVEYFSEQELQEQPDAEDWQKGEVVHQAGSVLQVDGEQAVEWGLAKEAVSGFGELVQLYGLEDDPAMLQPTWADILIEALGSPWVAVLLLMIGAVGLMIELQTPGVGIGGFVATTCFVLFFWSRFLGQTAGWLEILLFTLGLVFLALELFVLPGFGIFGLGGGALILVSLILAGQTFIIPRNAYQMEQFRHSLLVIVGAGIGTAAGLWAVNRWLPRVPGLGRIMLAPPSEQESQDIQQRGTLSTLDASWVGKRGKVTSPLLPSGKARIEGRLIDVVSEDFDSIDAGNEVEISEVRGLRVFVRRV